MKEQHDPIKKSVESFRPDFDKQALWNAIQTQIEEPQKKKKNRGFLFLFWISAFTICAGMTWWWMTPKSLLSSNAASSITEHITTNITATETPKLLSEICDETQTTSLISNTDKNKAINKTPVTIEQKSTEITRPSNPQSKRNTAIPSTLSNGISTKKQIANPLIENEVIYKKTDRIHQEQKVDPILPTENVNDTELIQSVQPAEKKAKIIAPTLQAQLLNSPMMDQLPLSDLQTYKQQLPKAVGHRSIEISSYFGSAARASKSNSTEGNQYLESKENMDQSLFTTGIDLKYNQRISKNWSAQVGLHYQRITDRLNVNETEVNTNSINSDSASFYVYTDQKTVYYPGTLTETITRTRNIQHYNHLDNLGMSLGLKWQEQLGKFSVYGSTNLVYFPWQKVSGRTINQDLGIANYSDTRLSNSFNKHQFSLQVEGGLQWRINQNWAITSGVQYRQDLNARFKTEAYLHRYRSVGLRIGVIKYW